MLTQQIDSMPVKDSGNPLQMRGLMHVLSSVYVEGMSLNDLQIAVGTVVQQQLQQSINSLDSASVQPVMNFLQNLDYTLTLEQNKEVIKGR